MPLLIGGITAMVALLAGIAGEVDPVATLSRAGIAFVLGWIAGGIWQGFFGRSGASKQHNLETPAETGE